MTDKERNPNVPKILQVIHTFGTRMQNALHYPPIKNPSPPPHCYLCTFTMMLPFYFTVNLVLHCVPVLKVRTSCQAHCTPAKSTSSHRTRAGCHLVSLPALHSSNPLQGPRQMTQKQKCSDSNWIGLQHNSIKSCVVHTMTKQGPRLEVCECREAARQ